MPRKKRRDTAGIAVSLSGDEEATAPKLSHASTPQSERPRKRKKTSGKSASLDPQSQDVQKSPVPKESPTDQEEDWVFLQTIKNTSSTVKAPSEDALDGSQGEPSELLSHSQMARLGDPRTMYNGKWYIGSKNHNRATKLQNIHDAFQMDARDLLDRALHPKDSATGANLPEDQWPMRFLSLLAKFAPLCTSERQLNRLLWSEIYQRDMEEVADSESDTEPRVGLKSSELDRALQKLRSKQVA